MKIDYSRCEGCGVVAGQIHKDGCLWLKKSLEEQQAKEKIRDMIEEFIDIHGLVDKIYKTWVVPHT